MTKPDHPEVGRELKVSDLKPPQVVWLHKMGGKFGETCATLWCKHVHDAYVEFWAGETRVTLFARRIGADRQRITDDSNCTMRIYEYLGKV